MFLRHDPWDYPPSETKSGPEPPLLKALWKLESWKAGLWFKVLLQFQVWSWIWWLFRRKPPIKRQNQLDSKFRSSSCKICARVVYPAELFVGGLRVVRLALIHACWQCSFARCSCIDSEWCGIRNSHHPHFFCCIIMDNWLVVWNMAFIFHFIYGMSSFPLTNNYFSEG